MPVYFMIYYITCNEIIIFLNKITASLIMLPGTKWILSTTKSNQQVRDHVEREFNMACAGHTSLPVTSLWVYPPASAELGLIPITSLNNKTEEPTCHRQ